MIHWHVSSCAGFLLTGQYRPLCAIVHAAPDGPVRRLFRRRMDRAFGEADHTQRIHDTWLICALLRGPFS